MQLEERISRACGRVAWSLFKGGLVCLVKAYTPVVFPLFALASLMAMLVGSEAWWPFLGFLKASAPLLFGLAFCVMLPSILGAVGAAYGLYCIVNVKETPTVSLVLVDRVSRYFWPVTYLCVSISRYFAIRHSTWDLNPHAVTLPVQIKLVTSVGLISSARRLQ